MIFLDNQYKKIDIACGSTIDHCVSKLMECKKRGELAYGVFNGVKLYSDTVNTDTAYKDITGMTKKEFDKLLNATTEIKREVLL